MNKMFKNYAGFGRITIIIAIVVVIAALATLTIMQPWKNEPIKIGSIISLSGPASNLVDVRDGMILAADEINSHGGINGRKIELIIEDSQTNPEKGKDAFNRIEAAHHPLLYVSTLSHVSMALSPLAKQNQVVLIGLVVGNPAFARGKKWAFRYYSSATTEIPPIIFVLRKLKREKLGILYSNDEYGRAFFSLLKEQFEKNRGIVKSKNFDLKDIDFKEEIELLRDMEAIYAVGFPKHIKQVFKQLKESDYRGVILGPSAATSGSLRKQPATNGVYVAAPIIYHSKHLYTKKVKQKYKAKYDKSLSHQAANGYDFLKLLAGLLEDKEMSRQNVRSLLELGFTYPGIFGTIVVKPGEHDMNYPLYPARIVEGEISYLK